MKILRTEEGRFTRTIELEIDETIVNLINKNLEKAIVNGAKFTPLTAKDIWDIMANSVDSPRYKEEYFVELKFYSGNMRLGDFVRMEVNDIFTEKPGASEESVDIWYDEFYP